MSENNYLNKTVFQKFQTLGYGDRIWPDVESENWQKVENAMLAMSTENHIKQVGGFSTAQIDTTQSTVTLSMAGITPAFEGVINSSYFKVEDPLVWNVDTTNNNTAYLYLTEISGQYDPTSIDSLDTEVSMVEYRTPAELEKRLLVAIATVTGGVGIASLNIDPEGTELLEETVYDASLTVGTDLVLDLRTILGTPTYVPELKFVNICVTSFSEPPVNPYFVWVEYNVGGYPYAFTIKSAGSTAYILGVKLLLRYSF